jgi:hypothetical protein
MGGTAAHGNTYPQPPSASVLTLRPTTPKPDKSVEAKVLSLPAIAGGGDTAQAQPISRKCSGTRSSVGKIASGT